LFKDFVKTTFKFYYAPWTGTLSKGASWPPAQNERRNNRKDRQFSSLSAKSHLPLSFVAEDGIYWTVLSKYEVKMDELLKN
jgi:hypothetical protein